MKLPLLVLATLLVAPPLALATEIPPGYRVVATRLADGTPFLGHLADPREGRSWLWIVETPVAPLGEREELFLTFDVDVERLELANGTLVERWSVGAVDHFSGFRVRVEDPMGSTEPGAGAGLIAGFAVEAYAR